MFLYLKNKYPLYIKDLHNQVLRFQMETQNKFDNLVVLLFAFKLRTNLFTKHITFNNFSKLLYISHSTTQQIFPSTDTDENAGAINAFPISWFKSKTSPQSVLNFDLGHTSSTSHKNDGPFHHNTSLIFSFLLYLVATSAELQSVGT